MLLKQNSSNWQKKNRVKSYLHSVISAVYLHNGFSNESQKESCLEDHMGSCTQNVCCEETIHLSKQTASKTCHVSRVYSPNNDHTCINPKCGCKTDWWKKNFAFEALDDIPEGDPAIIGPKYVTSFKLIILICSQVCFAS